MTEPFTRQQYTWEELTVPLTSAQSLRKIDSAGDYVRVDEASDPKAHVFVRLGDPFGPRRKLRLGGSIDGAEFQSLYLDWPAQEREGTDFAWVKLLIARTFGRVYFQNPDPLELDITGLVKMAPHVITDGGRRADHRYRIELFPLIVDTTSVSYVAGDLVQTYSFTASAFSMVGTTNPYGARVDQGNFWVGGNVSISEVDPDAGDELNNYSMGGSSAINGIAYDSQRYRIVVCRDSSGSVDQRLQFFDLFDRTLSSDEIALPFPGRNVQYDPWEDVYILESTDDGLFYVLDPDTGAEIRDLPRGTYPYEKGVWYHRESTDAWLVDSSDGSVIEALSVAPSVDYIDPDTRSLYAFNNNEAEERVLEPVSYSATGAATAGSCGAVGLRAPTTFPTTAEIRARREDDGTVFVQGEVIRAMLELYFQAYMPDNYLDHVYMARFERTGRVHGGGAETWASRGLPDAIRATLPQRVELTIDSDLEIIQD